MEWSASWITAQPMPEEAALVFTRAFSIPQGVKSAHLTVTATGVYEARLNGQRVGRFVLAPGWTSYRKRLQYQTYDVLPLLQRENRLTITVGRGWYHSHMPFLEPKDNAQAQLIAAPMGLLAQLELILPDGSRNLIVSDPSWLAQESPIRFSEIYHGECFDAGFCPPDELRTVCFDGPWETLIPQQGPEIREQERLIPAKLFTTPAGERVIDFGQEITGYVEISLHARAGEHVRLSFAEMLDRQGNFYTENYRAARAAYHYVCGEGDQTWHPALTFYGFRYVRIDAFPGGPNAAALKNFTAIVIHSDMRRTGRLNSSNARLNRFFDNVIWSQKGNFVDVPTDCPQRDERLGWTGDAQVFIQTACLNYDVSRFFTKWLADLAADQYADGRVGHIIPDILRPCEDGSDWSLPSAAWGDAAVICPWTVYQSYGDRAILERQFDSMKKWVDFITASTTTPNLWTGGRHYGDWLALDAASGSYRGASNEDLIATAFYAYSTLLLIKAGRALGRDMVVYQRQYDGIVDAFRAAWPVYRTQTECVLALHFHLARDEKAVAEQLAGLIHACGEHLETGFVGTPYLLHALSDHGHAKLAWTLLLRTAYPSWLYSVERGATTIWEHWDGIMEDGSFWSKDMNSFNHYAYGSVMDWVYTKAAGIQSLAPGYRKLRLAPQPDARLDWLEASLDTRYGTIYSRWKKQDGLWRYDIEVPVDTEWIAGETKTELTPGKYTLFSQME